MPTYDYKCNACGHAFERFQSITSPPITKCPECGKNKVKRLLGTGAGLIFKGSGFYITDYRDSGYKEAAKKDSGSSSSSDSSSSSSGDSAKPATSESKPAAPAKSESKSPPKSSEKKK
jgi:putative FmdB family regulatory protein